MNYVCVDCLIGPTYHYGGLAFGNKHSMASKALISNPKKAALQTLDKMKLVMDYGVNQYVLPPVDKLFRPLIKTYSQINGSFEKQLKHFYDIDVAKFSAIFSSSSAWMANAWCCTQFNCETKTVLNITIANLKTCFHRTLDVDYMKTYAHKLFLDKTLFNIYSPIKSVYGDEGSANMITLSGSNKQYYICVYGGRDTRKDYLKNKFPNRQEKKSWEIITSNHKLVYDQVVIVQQHPKSIDNGVFHNDVISFGIDNILVAHEMAYKNQVQMIANIKKKFKLLTGKNCHIIEISREDISLEDAVESYFFNSQLIRLPDLSYMLICPSRCKKLVSFEKIKHKLKKNIKQRIQFDYINVDESIKNGGGPACLRNGFDVNDRQLKGLNPRYKLTPQLYKKLKQIIQHNYPEQFELKHCLNPIFVDKMSNLIKKVHSCF